MPSPRRAVVLLLAALLGLSVLAAPGLAGAATIEGDAAPPTDYIAQQDQLSQPVFPETVREIYDVPTFDDETIHVEVVMPDPAAYPDAGPWPVIAEASPYHGTIADRKGIRIFPDPKDAEGNRLGMTGYFAPRGYAVAMIDLRGTGQSGGCLDHLGQNDAKDLTAVIEWLAAQDWSTGEVGLTGHSYVGSTPSVAAAQRPEGLVTIAPSAGLASMYDHQFQMGTPYYLQYVGPQFAYEALALDRHLPPQAPPVLGVIGSGDETGDDFGNNVDDTGCGMQNSALTAGSGQVTGQYQQWHAERDWRDLAAATDIPVFMIHGVNDNAARIPAAEWFFGNRFDRDGDKVWLGQWDHGSSDGNTRCSEADPAVGHVNCRFDQWKYALHAWFDKHLKHMDVDTGPSVEAFLNDGTVHTDDAWSRPSYTDVHADAADGSLGFEAPEEPSSVSFRLAAASGPVGTPGGTEFVSGPLAEDVLFMGLPMVELQASFTNSQTSHLITTLYREDALTGEREPMSYCAIQPQLRFGVQHVAPVEPGKVTTLRPQCFTMAHRAEAGDRLVMVVGDTSPHHVAAAADMEMTVHTGGITKTRVRLPVVEDANLHCDVARFEGEAPPQCVLDEGGIEAGQAQAPVSETVLLPAPSLALGHVEGVDQVTVGFDVEPGFDNARLDAVVTDIAGDVDIWLEREVGGSWQEVTSGQSFDLSGPETLRTLRPPPGAYRLRIVNFASAPGEIDVDITFYNSLGVAGE